MGHGASQVESKDATGGFLAVRIAEMNPQHDRAVLDLAWECGGGPLFQEDLDQQLRDKRSRVWLAIAGQYWEKGPVMRTGSATLAEPFVITFNKLVGFLHVRVFRHYLVVREIMVRTKVRRRSIARQLLLPAFDMLCPTTRRLMLADVAEENFSAHCFFRSAGFRCEDPKWRKQQLRDAGRYRFVLDLERVAWSSTSCCS